MLENSLGSTPSTSTSTTTQTSAAGETELPASTAPASPTSQEAASVSGSEATAQVTFTADTSAANDVESSVDLGKFLAWSHTLENPFDSGFVNELEQLLKRLGELKTLPGSLGEGMGVLSLLDFGMILFANERARLIKVYEDYTRQKEAVSAQHTSEEAGEWLRENMPQAYQRATNVLKLATGPAPAEVTASATSGAAAGSAQVTSPGPDPQISGQQQ